MPLQKIQIRPGIIRDVTNFTDEGGWYDGDKVRFRMGKPESIRGWAKTFPTQFLGVCRSLHQWTTLNGNVYTAIATNLKLYVETAGILSDITPIRRTVTLGTDPFTTYATGSGVLLVTDVDHGAQINDFVTYSGATAFDVFTTDDLNAEHQITDVIDTNTYAITISGASASAPSIAGGGAAVVAEYQINTGGENNTSTTGGWGIGVYSRGGWSTPYSTGITLGQLRVWSLDNFGEDLVAAVRGGGIYVWDASAGVGVRAVALQDLPGSNFAPTVCNGIVVSEIDRHLIVFGANEYGSSTQDELLVAWSSQESLTEWEPRRDTTAGNIRVSAGSRIIGWRRARQETLIWTDIGLNSMTFVGPQYTFGIIGSAQSISLVSQNCMAEARNQIYWMDLNAFRFYNGSVNTLPCPVQAYVFDDFNFDQRNMVYAGNNSQYNELWWFYPSSGSLANNRYVVYNYQDNLWSIGTIDRSAWLDPTFTGYPIATSSDGYLYTHETGFNADTLPLNSYIEGADLTIEGGENFTFISRIIPDFTILGEQSGQVTMQILKRNFPNQTQQVGASKTFVFQDTTEKFVRVRTRQFALRVSCSELNVGWRLGTPRFDMQADGRKW